MIARLACVLAVILGLVAFRWAISQKGKPIPQIPPHKVMKGK